MNLWFDLKYAWRLLRKSWGYSLMCASVVALSVGLAVWTYSLAYSQVWKPLGFPGSERWYSVQISGDNGTRVRPTVDAWTYQQLLAQNRTANFLGAFSSRVAVLSEGEASTSLRAAAISPRLFTALRVPPRLGRTFDETEGQPEAAPVAVLSHDTWQSYFAGDTQIVGKTVRIDSAPVQIVGVMPKDFFAFQDFELWLPLQLPQLARPGDSGVIVAPIVALTGEQKAESVLNELKRSVSAINADDSDVFSAARKVALIQASQMYTHSSRPIVAMLGFMSVAVLLLGCVNISMVFLARLLERSRELALRTALGASHARLMRQCLLETALVVILGLTAGYGLAALGVFWTQGISGFLTKTLASGRSANGLVLRPIDFLAAVGAAAVVWLLSTLIPAWRIARQDAAIVLAGSGKGVSVRASNKSVGLLVGLQVVISCLVLVLCGNVVLAVNEEVSKPNGLNTANVMISTAPTVFDDRYDEPAKRLRYWEDLGASVESELPGTSIAFATAAPTRPARIPAAIESQQGTNDNGTLTLPISTVSDNYFELLGMSVRSGRLFDSTDNDESLAVAVVDEQTASRYWPDEDAIGKRIQIDPAENGPWLTIVGVVSRVGSRPYRVEDIGVVYRSMRQAVPPSFQILAKLAKNDASAGRNAIRAAAFNVDRDLPLHNLQTLDDYLAALNLTYRAMTPVVGVVALITALLAASGLFGLINRSVAQRTQEVGIRRALGATPLRATSMFFRQGAIYLGVAFAGIVVGVLVMPALSASITNILDNVVLVTFGVVLLMLTVIFTASYLPTRRAVALEPGDALRYE